MIPTLKRAHSTKFDIFKLKFGFESYYNIQCCMKCVIRQSNLQYFYGLLVYQTMLLLLK